MYNIQKSIFRVEKRTAEIMKRLHTFIHSIMNIISPKTAEAVRFLRFFSVVTCAWFSLSRQLPYIYAAFQNEVANPIRIALLSEKIAETSLVSALLSILCTVILDLQLRKN